MALRKEGVRGQAFVIFDSVVAATEAMQKEQGLVLFGKPIRIQYAHEKSDRISKRDGTYVPKAKREKKDKVQPLELQQEQQQNHDESNVAGVGESTSTTAAASTDEKQPPSRILFAIDLPSECNEMMLSMLFRQYSGFKEVRIARDGLAFIEFDSEPHATLALERLNGFQLTTNDQLKLSYGKA